MTVRKNEPGDDTRQQEAETLHRAPAKKPFVEPTISSPVDVLEATTLLQAVESGFTG